MHLKSKLGTFEAEKLRYNKMANHIKVSYRHTMLLKLKQTLYLVFHQMCFSSAPGPGYREEHQRRVSEVLPVPESRGSWEDRCSEEGGSTQESDNEPEDRKHDC